MDSELYRLHALEDAAKRLLCSVKTLTRAADRGEIQLTRIGRHCRISEQEIRRIVKDGLGSRS